MDEELTEKLSEIAELLEKLLISIDDQNKILANIYSTLPNNS